MNIIKYFSTGIKSIYQGTIKILWYFTYGIYIVITIFPKYFILGIKQILNKKPKKTIQNKKLSLIIMALSFIVYLICVFYISRWYVQGLKIKYLTEDIISSTEIIEQEEETSEPAEEPPQDITEEPQAQVPNETPTENNKPIYYPNDYWDYINVPFMDVNFNELLNKNHDTVGWIKVEGTKVNYPIVQTDNNDYYLYHAFNKNKNAGGWIFADYRDNFEEFGKNTIIYGHNMNNKTMFGSIPQMLSNSYLSKSENYYIKVSTPTCNTVWKLFSIYTIEPEIYYIKTSFRTYSFEEFINTLKSRSIYNFGIDVSSEDKILTLSTCDNTGTKRIAVHAKMISIEYK